MPYWTEGIFTYGDLAARHIERGVKLGEIYRIEPANSAHAKRFSALIKGGLMVYDQNNVSMGPFIGLGFGHQRLSSVKDTLNHPTSLRLDASRHNKTYGLIGWQINTSQFTIIDKKANVSAEISYQQAFHIKPYFIQTGIKYTPFDIPKEVSLPKEKRWLSLKGYGQVKRLMEWLEQRGERYQDYEDSYFYSDSFNDIPLLKKVAHPVAVNPDSKLKDYATAAGWRIIVTS